MFAFLTAAAATVAQPAPLPSDPDLRCMAAYLVAAGQMDDDPSATAENKSGAQSIVMYFFGKIHALQPQLDVKGEIMRLIGSPEYLGSGLEADLARCSAEAIERGNYLQSFGEDAPAPRSGGSARPR
jgi:hypothetical protein